jgi:hypothetical protein
MSAMPLTAAEKRTSPEVRVGPIADFAASKLIDFRGATSRHRHLRTIAAKGRLFS